ncbi:hypothetical protein J8I87_09730 [Paraburkholderia sp. LEh10]|jgi:hypothetical protein|nr:hypothetical protein [Paraburkholderia sp. LEh10]MBP0589995.1 hypothetical protein [Paraburkholderia sp. LEh10]
MKPDETSNDTPVGHPLNAPRGEPEPPDTTKDLPELPDPSEVGEDG